MDGSNKKTIEPPGAVISNTILRPYCEGTLSGRTFVVKGLMDVGGERTTGGNPTWYQSHPSAAVNAVCIEPLLSAGATCIGVAVTDELAFGLDGENHFYGTPLNPNAANRIPGGSSSGSASAVACGLCDFALGTDTGGSVRVPASHCGVFGYRPSHGAISVAGITPFAPSFDTVGILSRKAKILYEVGSVFLGIERSSDTPDRVYVLQDALDVADQEVLEAVNIPLLLNQIEEMAREKGNTLQIIHTSLSQLLHGCIESLTTSSQIYCTLQNCEIWSSLGSWVEDVHPEFGPNIQPRFELAKQTSRVELHSVMAKRSKMMRAMASALGPKDLLVMPTTPTFAPLLGELARGDASGYYARTLEFGSVAGNCKLPQISLPVSRNQDGVPIGVSMLAAHMNDPFLLNFVMSYATKYMEE